MPAYRGRMTGDQDLVDLERDGWRALCADPATARTFYERVLADDVVMLLPGGLVLTGRDQALPTMGAAPWDDVDLEEMSVTRPTPETGLVTYGAVARREGTTWSALFSSLYAWRDGAWRMVLHQQTAR